MNVLLHAHYPGHLAKQAIQAFTSTEIPKRPDYVKEAGSIVYFNAAGVNVVFLFEVPDNKLAEFQKIQGNRIAFMGARVQGFAAEWYGGLNIMHAIKETMPLFP